MSVYYARLVLGLSLALAPRAISAQTAPFAPGTSSPGTASARGNDPLLAPRQVPGNYRQYLRKRHQSDPQARALLHMVGRKRTWGTLWSLVALGNTIRLFGSYEPVPKNTLIQYGPPQYRERSPVGNIIAAGICWPLGVSRWSRYNNQKLYRAFTQYEAGQGFPEYMENNIKDRDED